jgi:hypothetical protein
MVKNGKRNKSKIKRCDSPLIRPVDRYPNRLSAGVLPFLRKLANKGRIWGSSYELTDLRGGSAELDQDLLEEIDRLQKSHGSQRVDKDDFSIVMFDAKVLHNGRFPGLAKLLDSFIVEHFGYCSQVLVFNEYKPPPG